MKDDWHSSSRELIILDRTDLVADPFVGTRREPATKKPSRSSTKTSTAACSAASAAPTSISPTPTTMQKRNGEENRENSQR